MGTDSHQPTQIGVTPWGGMRENGFGASTCQARRSQPTRRRSTPLPLNLPRLAANENGAEGPVEGPSWTGVPACAVLLLLWPV